MLTDFKCPYKSCGKHFGFMKDRGQHTMVTCPHCGRQVDIGTKRKENANPKQKRTSKASNAAGTRKVPKANRRSKTVAG